MRQKPDLRRVYHFPGNKQVFVVREEGVLYIWDVGYWELDYCSKAPRHLFGWSNMGPQIEGLMLQNPWWEKKFAYWDMEAVTGWTRPGKYWQENIPNRKPLDGTWIERLDYQSNYLTEGGKNYLLLEATWLALPDERKPGAEYWVHKSGFKTWWVYALVDTLSTLHIWKDNLSWRWYQLKNRKK